MTEQEARQRMAKTPLNQEEIDYYIEAYEPGIWRDIINWAWATPPMDACDDVEADHHHA